MKKDELRFWGYLCGWWRVSVVRIAELLKWATPAFQRHWIQTEAMTELSSTWPSSATFLRSRTRRHSPLAFGMDPHSGRTWLCSPHSKKYIVSLESFVSHRHMENVPRHLSFEIKSDYQMNCTLFNYI